MNSSSPTILQLWINLPVEIKFAILKHLIIPDLFSFDLTCRQVSDSLVSVWPKIIQSTFQLDMQCMGLFLFIIILLSNFILLLNY